jgi:hypothetical protein
MTIPDIALASGTGHALASWLTDDPLMSGTMNRGTMFFLSWQAPVQA